MLDNWGLITERDIFLKSECNLLQRLEEGESDGLVRLVRAYEEQVPIEYYAEYLYLLEITMID